ncbi:DUF2163 domain-containing protein [Sphingomonas montanisoli]|uniref:DUF2163 domain-containing protein n=1 Tax=Sphingomonas montanisoli TaxID=2606412 RepID=A0A5D9CD49_9SPHN|nr:DUF2163 domain-containing protein [Sphingomonas montanisoli]TZG29276.1 DUF2163 domain-containing protein [Sphingomonas montanisoli]
MTIVEKPMTTWANPEVTALAFCWRIDRSDGVTVGFTSADRDLSVGGLDYRARPGMLPSAVRLSETFDVDTLDVSGAIDDAAISAGDLAAGRWDGARVRLYAVDRGHPDDAPMLIARGRLGDVEQQDRGFTAELRGVTAVLERPVIEQTSPECRAELGDRRCRVAMAGRRRMVRVVEAVDATNVRIDGDAGGAEFGRIDWFTGANSGLTANVRTGAGDMLSLFEAPAFALAVGDMGELIEGCDKGFATCRDRFGNAANFRGEPHLPGNDLLLRYAQG